ncbi:MAG TPA: asparagine synthase C-terminal domain-containing protein [Steroidobacteraceae bacterium]|jgi:asparagine synthase (glutamine-hydrolysing)
MLHFIALVWNSASLLDSDSARQMLRRFQEHGPRWQVALQRPGFAALYANTGTAVDEPYLLHDERGVAFGRLFERSYAADNVPARVAFDQKLTDAVVAGGGRTLIEKYWGQYVAFVLDEQDESTCVVRDPTGGVPCLTLNVHGIDVYFQRFEDCERLRMPALSINHRYVCGRLAYDAVSRRDSGLNEVSMVLPGERIVHRRGERETIFLWDPLQIAATDMIEDPAAAIRLTRETVRTCVHAWASCFDGILLFLSGGLDSSIVLSCLADAPTRPALLCLNDYSPGSNSDERMYARLAAERAGCRLIERPRSSNVDLSLLGQLPRAAYPAPACVDLETAAREAEFAAENALAAHFNGDGGDELFHRSARLPSSTDFAYAHGLRPTLLGLALNDAAYLHTSFWHVLDVAREHGMRRRQWNARELWQEGLRPLLHPHVADEARRDPQFIHPQFRGSPRLPPGKLDQAYHLTLHAMRNHNPLTPTHYPVEISPLLSQPFIELSLRIPQYVLTVDGRDRSVARYAFADDIPRQIALRKTKGGVEEFLKDLLARNLDVVQGLLLDGFLVQQGYLDRQKLERVLAGGPTDISSCSSELMGYLDIEAWARNWYDVRRRAVA